VDLVSQRCLGGVWETLDCRWLPGKPMVDRMAHNKLLQLVLASRLGFLVPNTLITNTPSRFLEFYADCESRIVGKSLAQMEVMRGGEMHMLTFTQPVLRRDALRAQAIRHAPVIFQKYVPKRVELRVTIVGRRVLTAEIASQDNRSTLHDFRHNDDGTVRYRPYDLPAEIERRCLAMAESLGLTYGAIDLILTPEGDYVFLEINSNGQWGWVETLSGLPIADAVANFLIDG
jgi:glutathione synthase/RimK-type ligase-like ATP-grasp enzyme